MNAIQSRYYDNFICQSFVRTALTSSNLLERGLSHFCSFYQSSIDSLGLTTSETTVVSTSRAWWDPKKGSAIVIWAAGEQDIAHHLSLALASVRQRKNLSPLQQWKSGNAPYTVIVLMPENSNHLPALIGAWAKRKAQVANTITRKDQKAKDYSFSKENDETQEIGENSNFSFTSTLDMFGLGKVASFLRLSDDPMMQIQEDDTEMYDDKYTSTRSSKRKLSIGGWTASDVVGYGRDMLKGLRIGETEQTGIGAVIPVVVDTATPSGLQHAQSTVQAYCVSHDLLLRALVLIPSIMQQDKQPVVVESKFPKRKSKASSPSISTIHEKLNQLAKSTEKSLGTDIGESLNLLATLLPIVRNDGGRIIGLVPSAAHIPTPRERKEAHINDDIYAPKEETATSDEMRYNIIRTSLIAMWKEVRQALLSEGVPTSLVHMMPYPYSTQPPPIQPFSQKNVRGFGDIKQDNSFAHRVLGNAISALKVEAKRATQSLILITLATLYGIPPSTKSSSGQENLYPGLPGWEQASPENATPSNSSTINLELQECPKLLLNTMKSALVRTWPRTDYSVGLGPHLESVWKHVPGHSIVNGALTELIHSLQVY